MSLIKQQKASPIKRSNKGNLSKKATTFLSICKENFGFEPAKEFIEIYSKEQELYQELYLEFTDKEKRPKMSEADVGLFWRLHSEIKDSLKMFMKYSYPTLRAMNVQGNIGVTPIFNINLGAPPEIEEVTNVTPEE